MALTEGIRKRAVRMGQILAFLAALCLAFLPHTLHAQSSAGSGHSHFGVLCLGLDMEQAPHHSPNGTSSTHGDCLHHFYSMVQVIFDQTPDHEPAASETLYQAPASQLNPSAEPPPPRRLS